MAFGAIPTIVDGDDATDDFPQAVKVTIDQLAKIKAATETGPDAAGPTVGTNPLTCDTITMPDQGAGTLHAWAHIVYLKTVSSDRFSVVVQIDGTNVCTVTEANPSASQPTLIPAAASGAKVVAAGARTIDVVLTRIAGTGTATVQAGSNVSLHYIFVPAP